MSAKSDNVRSSLAEQLTSFDTRIGDKADDVQLLAEIQEGIGDLLAENRSSETEIRRVLRQRYKAGALRTETFQLVESVLDRLVSEGVPTEPKGSRLAAAGNQIEEPDDHHLTLTDVLNDAIEAPVEAPAEDRFSSTTVLDEAPVEAQTAEERVQVGSVLRDRFLLQKRVSGGSMGVVYKALDRRLAEAGEKRRRAARAAAGSGQRTLPAAPEHRSIRRPRQGRRSVFHRHGVARWPEPRGNPGRPGVQDRGS